MFIPETLIRDEEKRRRESENQRLPLYAPQPPRQPIHDDEEDRGNSKKPTTRGVIIIDLEDYSEDITL